MKNTCAYSPPVIASSVQCLCDNDIDGDDTGIYGWAPRVAYVCGVTGKVLLIVAPAVGELVI